MSNFSDPLSYKQYWNQYNRSQENLREITTYDDMMREYAMIKGIPIEYYPINIDDYKNGMDNIYGENSRPKWDKKFPMVGIIEDFSQEQQQWGGIGLENIDEITIFIHKSMFDELIGIRTTNQTNKSITRRGAYGPISKDQVKTLYNNIVFEILTGGEHFLPSEAQHFGKKFWYKLTCKVRQVSDAVLGEGEQYGAVPDLQLDEKWKGNPQYLLNNPERQDWAGNTGTPITPSPSAIDTSGCNIIEYTTNGAEQTPSGEIPSDIVDSTTGQVKDKYIGTGMKENSIFGDNEDIKTEANQIIDPQTDKKVEPNSEEEIKYGPDGRVIVNSKRKDLFGDW